MFSEKRLRTRCFKNIFTNIRECVWNAPSIYFYVQFKQCVCHTHMHCIIVTIVCKISHSHLGNLQVQYLCPHFGKFRGQQEIFCDKCLKNFGTFTRKQQRWTW